MKANQYIKICCLFFCIVEFSGSMQAQSSQDAIDYGKSIRSQIKSQAAKQNSSGSEIWDEIYRIVRTTIQELNRQYQGRLSGSQSVYVLDTEWESTKAVFPDRNTCESGKRLISNKLDQYQKKRKFGMGTENRSFSAGQGFAESCQCKQQTNTSYDSNNSSHTNQANNVTADLHSFDNFNITPMENNSQIDIFTVPGAREENSYSNTNDKAPEVDLSNLDKYLRTAIEAEEPKEISATEIESVLESCMNSSNFCDCVQSNFTLLTGKNLQGKYSQIKSETDIANNKMFNEYLGKIARRIDARTDQQKNVINEQLDDIEKKFRAEWMEKYESAEILNMAKMADFVYNRGELPNGWKKAADNGTVQSLLKDFNDPKFVEDGFFAEIYQKQGTNEYVLAFRGSESPLNNVQNMRDWITNASQAMGSDLFRNQYLKSITLIKDLKATCNKCSISITGHSLGGGLASVAGLASGLPTYTFNAAGVHPNTIQNITLEKKLKEKDIIKAYYSNDDPLNQLQDKRFAKENPKTSIAVKAIAPSFTAIAENINIPPALGDRINIGDTGGHGIEDLKNTIEAPLKKETRPLENEKLQLDISKENLKMQLTNCAASE